MSELTPRVRAGIYYESGKEPPADGPPKLHLLVESNEEYRVRYGITYLELFGLTVHFYRSSKRCEKSSAY